MAVRVGNWPQSRVRSNHSPWQKRRSSSNEDMDVIWEVTADFHRLNVLLMCVEGPEHCAVARKVATTTLLEARIQATMGTGRNFLRKMCRIHFCNIWHDGTQVSV